MKKLGIVFSSTLMIAGLGVAQGPPPGGPGGPGGHGPWGRGGGPGGDFGIISAGPGSNTPVTGAPYTATETSQSQQKLQDGNLISRTDQSKIYRDSQGRVRMERTFTPPGQSAQTRITIFDPVGGFSYVLDPANSTASKMAIRVPPAGAGPRGEGRTREGANLPAVVTETLTTPPASVNVPATGTRTTTTIPAGAIGNQQAIQIVRETWISTVLKVPVYIKTSDPRFGDSTLTVNVLAQSEPDPTLFQVPSSYTVTTRGGAGPMGMRQGMRQGSRRD